MGKRAVGVGGAAAGAAPAGMAVAGRRLSTLTLARPVPVAWGGAGGRGQVTGCRPGDGWTATVVADGVELSREELGARLVVWVPLGNVVGGVSG